MNIQWNAYTWYSKLLALVFFMLILPIWTFYLGMKYQQTINMLEATATEAAISRYN